MLIACGYLLIADGCIDIGDGSEAADDEIAEYVISVLNERVNYFQTFANAKRIDGCFNISRGIGI